MRPLSRYAMGPEVVARLSAADVFREPIRLVLGARTARDGGLDAILHAGLGLTTVARLNQGDTTESRGAWWRWAATH